MNSSDKTMDYQKASQHPMEHLCFLSITMENCETIKFRSSDVESIELKSLVVRFPHISAAPELGRYYHAEGGVKICLRPTGNKNGQYTFAPPNPEAPFARLLHGADIVEIDLIYDRLDEPCNYLSVSVPYMYQDWQGAKSLLQTAWVDAKKRLVIEIISKSAWLAQRPLASDDTMAASSRKICQANDKLYKEMEKSPPFHGWEWADTENISLSSAKFLTENEILYGEFAKCRC